MRERSDWCDTAVTLQRQRLITALLNKYNEQVLLISLLLHYDRLRWWEAIHSYCITRVRIQTSVFPRWNSPWWNSSSGSASNDVLSERILKSIIRKLTPSQEAEYQSRSEYNISIITLLSYLGQKIALCPFMHILVFKLPLIVRSSWHSWMNFNLQAQQDQIQWYLLSEDAQVQIFKFIYAFISDKNLW